MPHQPTKPNEYDANKTNDGTKADGTKADGRTDGTQANDGRTNVRADGRAYGTRADGTRADGTRASDGARASDGTRASDDRAFDGRAKPVVPGSASPVVMPSQMQSPHTVGAVQVEIVNGKLMLKSGNSVATLTRAELDGIYEWFHQQ